MLKRRAMSVFMLVKPNSLTEGRSTITHRPEDTTIASVMETLMEQGFDGMADAVALLLNEAMKIERSEFLGAGPYKRSVNRIGSGNGFKDVASRN